MAAEQGKGPVETLDAEAYDLLFLLQNQFEVYERAHRAKIPQTADTRTKAIVNAGFAAEIDKFLGTRRRT